MKITPAILRFCLPVVVLLVVSVTTAAFAQDEGGSGRDRGGRGFGRKGRIAGKAMLLRSDQVRGELKITEEQGKAIDEILASYREEMRSIWGGRDRRDSDVSDEERRKKRQEGRKKFMELRKAIEAKIEAKIEASQNERLNQIDLQHRGVDGLSAESVATALALSEEQKAKIKEAVKAMRKEMQGLRGRRGGGDGEDREARRKARREKAEKIRKSTQETVMAMLTEEQAKKFEELKGKPFDLDRRSLRGGRGYRDGRGRGEGGREGKGKRKRPDADDAI